MLLNALYLLAITLASPIILWRMIRHGKYRDGWSEKVQGRLPERSQSSTTNRVWFHAVSVGEVLQLRTVVKEFRQRHPRAEIVISTTTVTGMDVARREFPQDTVCYFPLDFTWAVRRAIERVQASAIVLVELEVWPNFIKAAHSAEIPLLLINGRVSENSFRGYQRFRKFVQPTFQRITAAGAQNPTYAERLVALGMNHSDVTVTGSIKFDGVQTDRNNSGTRELRAYFGLQSNERVFIAGSTQQPEERIAIETWLSLRAEFPDLRLILVPRHRERFDSVAQLVSEFHLPLIRRSDPSTAARPFDSLPVLLLDTLGELGACWGLADIAFVGGSLTNRGGQNMMEPAGYGAAVLFGPNTRNFRDVVEMLLSADAALVVNDQAELTHAVRSLLQDTAKGQELGRRACDLVTSQRGATARTVDLISAHLATRSIREDAA